MKRALSMLVLGAGLLSLSTGCTKGQINGWLNWYDHDPTAAMEFAALPEIQEQLNQPQAEPAPASSGGGGNSVWDRLAQCESGGNWGIATGNGYYGGLQFLPSTWRANGGSGMPHHHSREEQIRVAENLREKSGFSPWPACSRKLGLR
jgi:hypothetical protein